MHSKHILRNTVIFLSMAFAHFAHGYCVQSRSEVVTLWFGVETALPDPAHPVTVPAGHTDIEIPLHFSGWEIHLHSEAAGHIKPDDGLFALNESHRYVLPAVPAAFAFLGVEPGQTFWYYASAPSPGFCSVTMSAAEIQALCAWDPNDPPHGADTPRRWLQVRLADVRGPQNGHCSMWQETGGLPVVYFSTYDGGIDEADVYYIEAGLHSHNRWAFTQPGLYAVDLQVSTLYGCDANLTADLNDDCFVDFDDYALLSRWWLREDAGDPNNCGRWRLSDPNSIDTEDLNEMTDQWLLCGSPFESECP